MKRVFLCALAWAIGSGCAGIKLGPEPYALDEAAPPRTEAVAGPEVAASAAALRAEREPEAPRVRAPSRAELLCERGDAATCYDLGVATLAEPPISADEAERAARLIRAACELDHAEGCYADALLIWTRTGRDWDAGAIEASMRRARALGAPGAARDWSELVDPPAPGQRPSEATLAHWGAACDELSIPQACDARSAFGEGQRSSLAPRSEVGAVAIVGVKAGGWVSEESARAVLTQRSGQLSYCYEEALGRRDEAEGGAIALTLRIGPEGRVDRVDAIGLTMTTGLMGGCLREMAKLWRFEGAPQTGAVRAASVVYMLDFSSSPPPAGKDPS